MGIALESRLKSRGAYRRERCAVLSAPVSVMKESAPLAIQ
jgi:hypothetical protein